MKRADGMLGFFDDKAASFDAIYSGQKALVPRVWDRLTRRNLHARLQFTMQSLSPVEGKDILDVGCGSGRYCVAFAARGASRVVGIDPSVRMLALAEALAESRGVQARTEFRRTRILDFVDASGFDFTVAMGLFDYVDNARAVLRHLRPLTRERLVASFPVRWAPRALFRKLWLAWHGCPVSFYTRTSILACCREAGFTCVTLTRSGPIYLLDAVPSRPGTEPRRLSATGA